MYISACMFNVHVYKYCVLSRVHVHVHCVYTVLEHRSNSNVTSGKYVHVYILIHVYSLDMYMWNICFFKNVS